MFDLSPQTISGAITLLSVLATASLMAIFKKAKWHKIMGRFTVISALVHTGLVVYKQYMLYSM